MRRDKYNLWDDSPGYSMLQLSHYFNHGSSLKMLKVMRKVMPSRKLAHQNGPLFFIRTFADLNDFFPNRNQNDFFCSHFRL